MKSTSKIRIIGGQWRGRKLHFPDIPGLRPTPDRVRETAFNWLQPVIMGARCLDLFAGSGALGFEALSRGATAVDMVDNHPQAVNQLRKNTGVLDCPQTTVHSMDASVFLQNGLKPYDIIFLDPPFSEPLVEPLCELIICQSLLKNSGCIYIEQDARLPLPKLAASLEISHNKKAGRVRYLLAISR